MPISSMPASRRPPFWITASASANGPGGIDVAADHQQPPHVGLAAQAGEQFLQVGRRCASRRAAICTTGSRPDLRSSGRRRDQFLAASSVGTAVK